MSTEDKIPNSLTEEGPARQSWVDADIERLLHLWNTFGSVVLIAAIMKRRPSSIQTQASRRQLPKRPTMPNQRKRWTDAEDKVIGNAVTDGRCGKKIDVLALSVKNGRSIDAIIGRMISHHGIDMETLGSYILIPTHEDIAKTGRLNCSPVTTMKTCPMCLKKFVPVDSMNRVCPSCKASKTWKMGM